MSATWHPIGPTASAIKAPFCSAPTLITSTPTWRIVVSNLHSLCFNTRIRVTYFCLHSLLFQRCKLLISGFPLGLLVSAFSGLLCVASILSRCPLLTQLKTPPRASANKSACLAIYSRFLKGFCFKGTCNSFFFRVMVRILL